MKIDQKTYELINLYLSGELSGRSLDAFKARLKKEADLKKKVQFQKALIDGINEVRSQELKKFITDNVSNKNKIDKKYLKILKRTKNISSTKLRKNKNYFNN